MKHDRGTIPLLGESSTNQIVNNQITVQQASSSTTISEHEISTKIRITRQVFLCSACGTYYEKWNLFLHMREVHRRLICLFCLGIFPSAEKLVNHLEHKHNQEYDQYNTRDEFRQVVTMAGQCCLMCCKCEHVFNEYENFDQHLCENYSQPCTLCGQILGHSEQCKATVKRPVKSINKRSEPDKEQEVSMSGTSVVNSPQVNGITNRVNKLKLRIKNNSYEVMDSDRELKPEDGHQNGPMNPSMYLQNFVPAPATSQYYNTQEGMYLPTPETQKEPAYEESDEEPDNDDDRNNQFYIKNDLSEILEERRDENQRLVVPKLKVRIPKVYQTTPFESEQSSLESESEEDEEPSEQTIDNSSVFMTSADKLESSDLKMDQLNEVPMDIDTSITHQHDTDSLPVQLTDLENKPDVVNVDLKEPITETNAELAVVDEVKPLEIEEDNPDEIKIASDDVPLIDLRLEQPLDKFDTREFVRICLTATIPNCLYCNHARKIAVNGRNLTIHLISSHRFAATVDSITAEELLPSTIVAKLQSSLEELQDVYLNLETYDSSCTNVLRPPEVKCFECFQCRFQTMIHKELCIHNRKMHVPIRTIQDGFREHKEFRRIMFPCLMCKFDFHTYSELFCHMCPGIPLKFEIFDIKYRCCICSIDNIPSAFRLMVHLRKKHSACDVCLEECGEQFRLSSHIWKHKLQHLCYRCGVSYVNKPLMMKHLFWKHGTESVMCKKCLQKKWPHSYHFCAPPAQFICEICQQTFSRAMALRVHKRLHAEDGAIYSCTEENCEKKFISKKLLAKHVERHRSPLPAIELPIELVDASPLIVPEEKLETDTVTTNTHTTIRPEVTNEDKSGSSRKLKKKKSKLSEAGDSKSLLNLADLPALNLSESDSSDESDQEKGTNESNCNSPLSSVLVSKPEEEPNVMKEEIPVNGNLSEESEEENEKDKVVEGAAEEEVKTSTIIDIWENFKSFQASQIQQKTLYDDSYEIDGVQPPEPKILHVVQSDHDYCHMYREYLINRKKSDEVIEESEETINEVNAIIQEVAKEIPSEFSYQIQELNEDEKEIVTDIATTTVKSEQEKEKISDKSKSEKKENKTDDSSDSSSSSDSDSSCSCETSNCSCTSGSSDSDSSSSSSSSSSSTASRQRKKKTKSPKKKESQQSQLQPVPEIHDDFHEISSPTKNVSISEAIIDVVNTKPDHPDDIINESDLETVDTETDEDFYDDDPQKLDRQMLAEQRREMLQEIGSMECNSVDMNDYSMPPTPSMPEEEIKPKKVKVKKKKRDRNNSKIGHRSMVPLMNQHHQMTSYDTKDCRITSPLYTNSPPVDLFPRTSSPLFPYSFNTDMAQVHAKPASICSQSRPSTGSNTSEVDAFGLKRSKRRRIPNKFYGYSSDEEGTPSKVQHLNQSGLSKSILNTLLAKPPKRRPSQNLVQNKTPKAHSPLMKLKITNNDGQYKQSFTPATPKIKILPPMQPAQQQQPPIPPIIIRSKSSEVSTNPYGTNQKYVNMSATNEFTFDSDPSDSGSSSDEGALQIDQTLNTTRRKSTKDASSMMYTSTPTVSQPSSRQQPTKENGIHQGIVPIPFQRSPQVHSFKRLPVRPPAGCRPAMPGERVYCYCHSPYDENYEMIACDSQECPIEWFHFECVGIVMPPVGKWYCPECVSSQDQVQQQHSEMVSTGHSDTPTVGFQFPPSPYSGQATTNTTINPNDFLT